MTKTKGAEMNKRIKATNKLKPISRVGIKPIRFRVAALLNTSTTLGAAVLIAAMSGAKRPIQGGD
ncbi:MAG: hypothetical protein ND866_00170 [Pyrinomonadaceae bacterium]|nr:hypothetical protein [Pyrinomonadaceae bacterium]